MCPEEFREQTERFLKHSSGHRSQKLLAVKNTFEYLTNAALYNHWTQREKLRGFVDDASLLPSMMDQSCSYTERRNNVCDITENSGKTGLCMPFFLKHIGLTVQKLRNILLFLVLLTMNVPFINDGNDYRCKKNAHDKFLQPRWHTLC